MFYYINPYYIIDTFYHDSILEIFYKKTFFHVHVHEY